MFDHKWVEDDFLGLDHIDKTTKRTGEKAVFIRTFSPLFVAMDENAHCDARITG